ncbi:hypothetical protein OS242_06645 [Tumebacillus sp. DT12]|uniref:Uncharacterized protein n=1 Tax=Tumebacillus lacus TaxID=2995335 RepID=A0ABT3X0X8_9BACL|nr:hypothetical protein [Tumebacillus lacus]MCX7569637.1 hypothetical protein [Tumebacillus lacus]
MIQQTMSPQSGQTKGDEKSNAQLSMAMQNFLAAKGQFDPKKDPRHKRLQKQLKAARIFS